MGLKFSALLAIAVAAFGLDGSVLYILPYYGLSAIIIFFVDHKKDDMPVSKPEAQKQSRYNLIELTTGRGWGSKREELRAHLLGVWEPRNINIKIPVSEDQEAKRKEIKIRNMERIGYVGLFAGVIAAYSSWLLLIPSFMLSAFMQYRLTNKWCWLSSMSIYGTVFILAFGYLYSPHTLAMLPASLIFARNGGD
ncbi:MAG: hypothetical protein M0Z78_08720 [Betaproteobacteria bacterium]|nr:hypothetical protein [Betaproteobacteria bacterium]